MSSLPIRPISRGRLRSESADFCPADFWHLGLLCVVWLLVVSLFVCASRCGFLVPFGRLFVLPSFVLPCSSLLVLSFLLFLSFVVASRRFGSLLVVSRFC